MPQALPGSRVSPRNEKGRREGRNSMQGIKLDRIRNDESVSVCGETAMTVSLA